MRSAILIGVAIFIAVLAGGYGLTWYGQAKATRQAIENAVANINKTQKLVSYDRLETSGFPRQVNVAIVHPRFSGRMDVLMKQISDAASQAGTPMHTPLPTQKEWEETATLNGQIIFGVSALSDHYTMQVVGNWTSVAKVDGKTFTTNYNQSGGTFCSLQLQRNASLLSSLWNYETLARDSAALTRDFRMFDCAFPSTTVTQDSKTLGRSGPARFYISNAPLLDVQHMRVYLNATDIEATPDGDEAVTAFFRAIDPSKAYPRNLSAYGKQAIDIDFSYNGPSSLAGVTNPNLEISLGKFDIGNAAYKTHVAFFVKNAFDGTKNHSKLTFRGDSSFTPQYDTLVRDLIRSVIEEAYTSADPRFMEFQATMHQYTPEQMYAIIAPTIPTFSALGNVVQSLDLDFTGDQQLTNAEATLNDLELSVTPYGIKGNGIAKRENGGQPSGQMGITCTNCAQMIDDVFNYAYRLDTALMYFNPQQAAAMAPNPQLAEGIKNFLLQLSGQDKVNWAYDIVSDPKTGITVNGKSLSIVLQLYGEFIVPALKQNPAPQHRFSR